MHCPGAGHGGALAILLLLAACSSGKGGDSDISDGEPLACRIPGSSGFKDICTVDKMNTPDGMVLTARMPDGGFRRFLIVKDGRGVIAADGAEPVTVEAIGPNSIDVTADDITYRLPAKITS